MEKPPCVKAGSPMNWCARGQFDQFIEGRVELPSTWWRGWRIVKKHIVGPGGIRFDAERLAILWTLNQLRQRDDIAEFIAKCAALAKARAQESGGLQGRVEGIDTGRREPAQGRSVPGRRGSPTA